MKLCNHTQQTKLDNSINNRDTFDIYTCDRCGEIIITYFVRGCGYEYTIPELIDAKKLENSLYALLEVKQMIDKH